MCCTRLDENTERKNSPKFAIWASLHNFVGLYLCNWGMYQQSEKNLFNSSISSRCPPQYGELWSTNGWDRFTSLGHQSKFQRVSRVLLSLLQRRRSPEANQTARRLGVSWAGTLYIHFRGLFPPPAWRNFARCKIHFRSKSCVVLYWQHYCTAFQQRASAKLCGVVQGSELRNFRRGLHLFCWAAITLGISPHSSWYYTAQNY